MDKDILKVLVFGDIFGRIGREVIKENIESLKKKFHPDLIIANIENMTHGSGFSAKTVEEMFDAGIDVCTGGDHSFDNAEGVKVLKIADIPVLRPSNISDNAPGTGHRLHVINGKKILIINLLGRLYMKKQFMNEQYSNPFAELEQIIKQYDSLRPEAIIVDMHAETTSEKVALAHFIDGTASLVFGTHTHVPTADERVLPNGTGFITDVGFNGPLNSVIGMQPEGAIKNFRHPTKTKVSIVESGPKFMNAIVATIDTKTTKCLKIERVNRMYE